MSEEARALRSIAFWHYAFAATFTVFAVVITIIGMKLVNEFSAYHQCARVEDSEFAACYNENK